MEVSKLACDPSAVDAAVDAASTLDGAPTYTENNPGVVLDADVDVSDAELDEAGPGIPWGRLGRPEDIGKAAVFLCSDDADYITGEILTIDGGIRLKGYRNHQPPPTTEEKDH